MEIQLYRQLANTGLLLLLLAFTVLIQGCMSQANGSVEEIATEESAIDPLGTGDLAPDFTLPDSNGNTVNLADSLLDNRLTILVFYFSHT